MPILTDFCLLIGTWATFSIDAADLRLVADLDGDWACPASLLASPSPDLAETSCEAALLEVRPGLLPSAGPCTSHICVMQASDWLMAIAVQTNVTLSKLALRSVCSGQ